MKTTTKVITSVSENLIPLNINNIQTQLQIQAHFINGGSGSYSIQGNIGMRDDTIAPGATAVKSGYTIPDPNGWYDIQASTTTATRLGNDDLANFIPMAFIKVNVTAISGGQLQVNVLQQSIK